MLIINYEKMPAQLEAANKKLEHVENSLYAQKVTENYKNGKCS